MKLKLYKEMKIISIIKYNIKWLKIKSWKNYLN